MCTSRSVRPPILYLQGRWTKADFAILAQPPPQENKRTVVKEERRETITLGDLLEFCAFPSPRAPTLPMENGTPSLIQVK